MKSIVKLFLIILIIYGSSAGLVSDTLGVLSKASEKVTSTVTGGIQSLVNATSNISAGILLKALTITDDGILNLNGLIQTLNLPDDVNVTSILNSLNISVPEDGQVDLKNIFQNSNLTNANFSDVLSLLNVTTANGVLDFSSLIQNVATHVSFSDYLSKLIVHSTEDGLLDFTGLALKYCGAVMQYNVTTEDGYILDVYRIPSDGKVVVLSHGVMCTSDDFLIKGKTSLICSLAQAGFDVWVINYRGNRYSRRHIELDPDTDRSFWNFSMQEFGYYDLPAVIDFALNTTGKTRVSLIGHSEGTSVGFVLFSTRPKYNELIDLFVTLSPVVYFSDSGLPLRAAIRAGLVINDILLAFGVEELVGYDSLSRKLFQFVCSQGKVGYNLCIKVASAALFGYDPHGIEPEFFLSLLGHFPAGTSRKNLIHYVQVGNSDRFAQYDYESKNEEFYGTELPPIYDLTKVTCKVSMYVGQNDKVVGLKDVERIVDQLPNVDCHIVDYGLYNHVDFLYANFTSKLVYEPIIAELSADN